MRGSTAKKLRRSAKKLSHSQSVFRRTYKHLKSIYKRFGNADVVGYTERELKRLRLEEEKAAEEERKKTSKKELKVTKHGTQRSVS